MRARLAGGAARHDGGGAVRLRCRGAGASRTLHARLASPLSPPRAAQGRLAALCAAAGLTVLSRLDAGACDVCVAKDVRAEAYQARGVRSSPRRARRGAERAAVTCGAAQAARDRGVPVVREAWVDACARAGAAVSSDDAALRLPPFAGLRISVTGVAPGARRAPPGHGAST